MAKRAQNCDVVTGPGNQGKENESGERMTVYLPPDLAEVIRVVCARRRCTLSEAATEAFSEWSIDTGQRSKEEDSNLRDSMWAILRKAYDGARTGNGQSGVFLAMASEALGVKLERPKKEST